MGLYMVIFPGERPPVVKTVTSMENPSTPDALWAGVSAGKAIFQSSTREGRSREIRTGPLYGSQNQSRHQTDISIQNV